MDVLVCNGDFSQTSGVLLSPQNVSLYYCEWERSKLQQELGTLVLRINIRYLTHAEKHFSCRHSASLLEISYGIYLIHSITCFIFIITKL